MGKCWEHNPVMSATAVPNLPDPDDLRKRPVDSVPPPDLPLDDRTANGGLTLVPTPMASDRLVLTVAEAGELLGISRAFAYELAARGDLPVIRLGRRIVVPKAALLRLVEFADPSN
jgi:excisionase family DNA binding protein